ncbi:MAG TPA: CotH kinase family protein, partial [Bacteroidales bacterium]|nr:CotH kinase family protein [Bacteroidales bacterium]
MNKILTGILFFFLLTQYGSAQPALPDNGPLYADTTVPRIDITINPDTLEWIYYNPESDREFRAVFAFTSGTIHDIIDPVGFRLRGNTSRYSKKKSFKVSFNTYTEGGKYYGVEKLNLNGEHNDPSVMRSKLMWDILRKWEIPAPRANHVRVYINGNYYGLYLNVEHIDEEFVLSRFGNKDGNLYKCLYPADLAYLGADPDSYKLMSGDRPVYELMTNTEENDYSDLAAFISVLENSPDERLICDLEALFNTYDYLKLMAADIFCGDWDGYIYNKNNFYLYHNTETGKMEYIPYDVDNTFGIDWFNIDWAERNIYDWKRGGSEQRPLYDRIINNNELRQQFTFYAGQLISGTIDMDSLTQSIESRKNMIAPYIAADPYYPLDYGYDYGDFMLSYTSATGGHVKYGLYPYISARSQSMSQQLEAGTMAPVIKYISHRRDPVQGIEVTA